MARPSGTKKVETPEKLWQYFLEYKEATKSNPIKVTDWVGGMAKEITREKERPLTIDGFECWCYDNNIISDLSNYFANSGNNYSDYSTICTHIKKTVREDQISGGMAGIYNPSITQRLNGLVEKQEIDNKSPIDINITYAEDRTTTTQTSS